MLNPILKLIDKAAESIAVGQAYLVSFLKRNQKWEFSDYPFKVRKQRIQEGAIFPGVHVPNYKAHIINWPVMCGFGDTRMEAIEKLKHNFENHKEIQRHLPRPGKKVPIEFAGTDNIEKHKELVYEFFQKIYGEENIPLFISDESSLYDFSSELEDKVIAERIQNAYGININEFEGRIIYKIFEKIKEKNAA